MCVLIRYEFRLIKTQLIQLEENIIVQQVDVNYFHMKDPESYILVLSLNI